MESYQMQSRKLSIDFEVYTDGNSEFKQELIVLIIQNLRELDQALESGIHQPDLLKKTIHKMAPTISMINDTDLSAILHIKDDMNSDTFQVRLNQFRTLCSEVIRNLEYELELEASLSKAA